jgi:hypothetical protein
MMYPDGEVFASVKNVSIALERALDLKRLDKSWSKAFVAPLRFISGVLTVMTEPGTVLQGGRIIVLQPTYTSIK